MAKTMLNSQRNFVEYLEQVNALVKEAGLDKSKDTLIKLVKEQELLVPVVGGFSAGKSTAINAFLGEDILSVAITPETALATELRYTDGQAYAQGVKENGQIEELSLNEFVKLKERAEDFAYAKVFLNNEKLKSIEPLILVDMPGFDAPVEAHNKAIMEYLARGAYFVILESASSGTLAMSIKRHIENLQTLGRSFSFALTKCDLKPKSELDEIKTSIADELKDSFDYDKSVFLLDLKGGLDKVIKDTKSSLQTKISALKANKNEALEAVKELEKAVEKINSTQENLNTDTNECAQNAAIATINVVAESLRLKASEIANAALNGEEAMNSVVSEIVQNVLLKEFNARAKTQRERLINTFKGQISDLNLDSLNIDATWVNDISKSINNALMGISTKPKDNLITEYGDKVVKILIVSLGKLLSKLPVPLQLKPIIVGLTTFLPTIIGFFKGKTIDEKALGVEVVSKIKESLQDEVLNAFKNNFEAIQKFIAHSFKAKFEEKQAEINAAQEQKAQILGELDDKIQALNGVSGELDSLANKYLYA